MKKVATIAGSDATGGGGLEADLKTFQEFGTFGFAAITSIVNLDRIMAHTIYGYFLWKYCRNNLCQSSQEQSMP